MVHGPLTRPFEGIGDSVATIIREVSPFALCPSCIASKLTLAESKVRHAMQFLVSVTSEFAVVNRMCSGCHTTTKLVALEP
jgi:hypothetical protein